jgi:hypothetical protein
MKNLITIALERQCAKQNAKSSPSNLQSMIGNLEDKNIITYFSSIIHEIVNYYLFVKKCSSLCHNIIVNDEKIYNFKFKK